MTFKRNCLIIALFALMFCAVVLILSSCMGAQCSRPPSITEPHRTLKVVLVWDETFVDFEGKSYADRFIATCGKAFMAQTGIYLELIEMVEITKWEKSGPYETILEVQDKLMTLWGEEKFYELWNDPDVIYIGMGQSLETGITSCLSYVIPIPSARIAWAGVIDDTYRRIIRMREGNCIVMQHELAHAFILNSTHGDGLMGPALVGCLPGVTISGACLAQEDLDELLENKWRDFSKKVRLGNP